MSSSVSFLYYAGIVGLILIISLVEMNLYFQKSFSLMALPPIGLVVVIIVLNRISAKKIISSKATEN